MKLAILFAVLCGLVLSMPKASKRGIDECGAKDIKRYIFLATGNDKMDIVCEMCLDLVLIAETYAECEEEQVAEILEKKCDKDFSSAATDKLCRSMVKQIAHEVITDTEQDPTKTCYKVIHKQCTYSAI
ncbi:unnamed protein product [Cylicocyclus nassatus]|uniref:Saposin B-type domain-containing protein n=1 Tax=Cylicocyclus nassatus TaxID=53992 RepID=A0AA36HF06_CYLNA|nr:unnamed protein product [Cylicocyclus nassatus]